MVNHTNDPAAPPTTENLASYNHFKKDYLALITNEPFVGSIDRQNYMTYEAHCKLAKEIGCNLPTLSELVTLHISTPELAQIEENADQISSQNQTSSIYWRRSNTYCATPDSPWGIEHVLTTEGTNTIYIIRQFVSSFFGPPCFQGVIRFFPPKNDDSFCFLPALPKEIIGNIFMKSVCLEDVKSVQALALTCKYCYEKIIGFTIDQKKDSCIGQLDLQEMCPNLSILGPEKFGFINQPMPSYNKLHVLNACHTLLSKAVLNNQQLTLLVMNKELTINKLVSQARQQNVTVLFQEKDNIKTMHSFNNLPKQTYLALITHDLFDKAIEAEYNKEYEDHYDLAQKIGCDLPTLEELLALHIFTPELFVETKHGIRNILWRTSQTCHGLEEYPRGIELVLEKDNQNKPVKTIMVTSWTFRMCLLSGFQGVIRFFPPQNSEK